jgi:hypothetical protein
LQAEGLLQRHDDPFRVEVMAGRFPGVALEDSLSPPATGDQAFGLKSRMSLRRCGLVGRVGLVEY